MVTLAYNLIHLVFPCRIASGIIDIINRIIGRSNLAYMMMVRRDSRLLMPEFRKQRRKHIQKGDWNDSFWLMYIQCLIEGDQIAEAKEVFRCFVRGRGTDNVITRCPWVAAFAVSEGLSSNPSMKDSARISEEFEKSRAMRAFESLVKGKNIALVGNGPSEMGRGLGGEIDAHDVVIRINNYRINGFERDYGSRTDIWVKAIFDAIDHTVRSEDIKMIYYAEPIKRMILRDDYLSAIKSEIKEYQVDCFCPGVKEWFVRNYGISPTTGLTLINYLLSLEIRSLEVYGFSFLQEKYSKYVAYSGEPQNAIAHNMLKEIVYLRHVFGSSRKIVRE